MFFVDVLNLIKPNTRDLRKLEQGVDYFIDFADAQGLATLTTDCIIHAKDVVLLLREECELRYIAKEVDYYWDDNSIRTVLLKLSTEEV